MGQPFLLRRPGWIVLAIALVITACVYWPGVYGGWLFDDYPNIVDNHGVQPSSGDLPALINAALSSPASEFKRPLASLSFAANYLMSGLDPYGMKVTNLAIHLLNGLLLFLLSRRLLRVAPRIPLSDSTIDISAALITMGWLLLPINLTAVLYVVQRMESMANLFVLLGLIGYLAGRQRSAQGQRGGSLLAAFSIVICTALGLLAKETAVMLPFYALLLEWLLFGFRYRLGNRADWVIATFFTVFLVLPLIAGSIWLLPLLRPEAWATRDFTLATRLYTEVRVIVDYIAWTLLPWPDALSFYHDDYSISAGLLSPPTTLACAIVLALLTASIFLLRKRRPLMALGLAFFLGGQLLTGTVLPLELVYEHRNYFPSFGCMLVLTSLLLDRQPAGASGPRRWILPTAFAILLAWWTGLTAVTAYAWGDSLRLSEALADRGPQSPRAQYELGRTYIIYSRYQPSSPYTQKAYAPLERAAALPQSSILPQQALIFMNARMELPLKDAWWTSMIDKLRSRRPGVQDESSLGALSDCARDHDCELPHDRMVQAYEAALAHPEPTARLFSMYGDYAWNVLDDHALGLSMTVKATKRAPNEPAYWITLARMLIASGQLPEAANAVAQLDRLNLGGRLDSAIVALRDTMASRSKREASTVPTARSAR